MRFNVGDRVRVCCAEKYDGVSVGECGTVVKADLRSVTYAVRFDERDLIGKHNCDGLCEDGYGWWCDEDMLEPAPASAFRGGKIPNVSFMDYADSLCDALRALGSVTYSKQTKEDKSMIFKVIDGERVDKTCNKKVQTKITEVRVGELEGVARCDADEYNERDGVLNAIANAVCGNFDREYGKFLARKKREYEASCKCAICGHTADKDGKPYTPEDARACEAAHEARKKAKREAWLEKREAAKRPRELEREGRIEEYMKQIANRNKK